MTSVVVLDAGPLGLVTQRKGVPEADACKRWLATQVAAGVRVIVPEIADYEVRRELLRARKTSSVARLDAFNAARPDRYLPLTTRVFRRAASLWAEARQHGLPTSDPQALDADVLLAAQVLETGLRPAEVVVATTNVGHLSRFVEARLWREIDVLKSES
ncbi:MAG: nuclease [Planctomycetes bacterium]|nr:nuclease [Planctomycetota bacterium]